MKVFERLREPGGCIPYEVGSCSHAEAHERLASLPIARTLELTFEIQLALALLRQQDREHLYGLPIVFDRTRDVAPAEPDWLFDL